MRWLLNATAAVNTGVNGGDAMKARFRDLQRELQRLGEPASPDDTEPISQTPRSQAEFEAMLREES
jgi:hypothetical protein